MRFTDLTCVSRTELGRSNYVASKLCVGAGVKGVREQLETSHSGEDSEKGVVRSSSFSFFHVHLLEHHNHDKYDGRRVERTSPN